MARFTVKHNQAIWETTTFEVEIPEPLPETTTIRWITSATISRY